MFIIHMFFTHRIYYILLYIYIYTYICIPLGILRSTPDVAAWSCQCVEAHHRVRSLINDFNTPSTCGPALSMGVGAATG